MEVMFQGIHFEKCSYEGAERVVELGRSGFKTQFYLF